MSKKLKLFRQGNLILEQIDRIKGKGCKDREIFRINTDSFHYLDDDSAMYIKYAEEASKIKSYNSYRHSRSAILLYIMAIEALINRIQYTFLSQEWSKFCNTNEKSLSLKDKINLISLIFKKKPIDWSKKPWLMLGEIIKLRNDFVHPKSIRWGYYIKEKKGYYHVQKQMLPQSKQVNVYYINTNIPKNPYAIRTEHAKIVAKIVRDTVDELDKLLNGKIKKGNWLHSEEGEIVKVKDID